VVLLRGADNCRSRGNTMRTLRARIVGVIVALMVTLTFTTSSEVAPAGAINPPQSTVVGTVNTLYWDIAYFTNYITAYYGRAYTYPGIGYSNSYYWNFGYGCELYESQVGVLCANGSIYLNAPVLQSKINRLGDYAAGFWLAHEFGHHLAAKIGWNPPNVRGRELLADCIAGVFTKYGYRTGRLNGSDLWEGFWTLGDSEFYPYNGGQGYPTKADRRVWYQYGYDNYDPGLCAWYAYSVPPAP